MSWFDYNCPVLSGFTIAALALTNREVREWYLNEVASIPLLDHAWLVEGLCLGERARRAWEIRHRARVAARALMADPVEVEMLRKRDLAKYGNPDGPSFEQLVRQAEAKGLTEDQAYEGILASSTTTDTTINRKYLQ